MGNLAVSGKFCRNSKIYDEGSFTYYIIIVNHDNGAQPLKPMKMQICLKTWKQQKITCGGQNGQNFLHAASKIVNIFRMQNMKLIIKFSKVKVLFYIKIRLNLKN